MVSLATVAVQWAGESIVFLLILVLPVLYKYIIYITQVRSAM